ncbi:sensor histidine kinase [Maritimibacter fusiformis]|uniref:C4-dicarboxylate transport sensor protein DctB n=1 Tax=Maritimibacter fusiformis TaxID=2603819 RepID=A0A5D0RN41_9RHOB|nr:ATP-binding protein [Maritimibacter fusiformis]TYB83000.1 sensor histidine kinase [Maritimibacter fusiformis]
MNHARQILGIAAFVLLVAGFAGGVWWFANRNALEQIAGKGRADLALAADRVSGQMLRYRELAVVLARHPDLAAILSGAGDVAAARAVVLGFADMTGALTVELVDARGRLVVASTPEGGVYAPGELPLSRALNGALGTRHRVETDADGTSQRIFAFAAPVFGPEGKPIGAVLVEADVRRLEENWPGNAPAVFFYDAGGRVLISNRSDLVLARLGEGGSFPDHRVSRVGEHEIWHMPQEPYLPDRALYLERDMPVLGLRAGLMLDTASASRIAVTQAALAGALGMVFGVLLFLAAQRQRALAGRLMIEEAMTAELERRVAARTRDLSRVNADLRREVTERKEAELALKRAQAELVQAGKLTALGEMSAGISHELNQPLMAIRSYAENGEMFMERGNEAQARENLTRISELARRMGRIIRNLRAFARQENEPISDVDMVQVIEAALDLARPKLKSGGVTLDWVPPTGPVMVRGGEVRLQQVVMNLVSNAADAMVDSDRREISITLDHTGSHVSLSVRDTGPGIAEPERMFDPFYSTKAVGAAEGMGLGLSISYGLVQSFGGAIRGANHPGGGAVFTVELVPAGQEVAA